LLGELASAKRLERHFVCDEVLRTPPPWGKGEGLIERVCVNERETKRVCARERDIAQIVGAGAMPGSREKAVPLWSRVEGKYLVNPQEMLPDSGSILRGVYFWEVPFAIMLSSGWGVLRILFVGPSRFQAKRKHLKRLSEI